MQKITKQEIIDFANEFYNNDYSVVYKRAGKATDVQKIEKPTITQVEVNRDETSPFAHQLLMRKHQGYLQYLSILIQIFNVEN